MITQKDIAERIEQTLKNLNLKVKNSLNHEYIGRVEVNLERIPDVYPCVSVKIPIEEFIDTLAKDLINMLPSKDINTINIKDMRGDIHL